MKQEVVIQAAKNRFHKMVKSMTDLPVILMKKMMITMKKVTALISRIKYQRLISIKNYRIKVNVSIIIVLNITRAPNKRAK